MKKIEILLSTYNGEKFIREQLDSLLKQTYQDFKIIIRDDGSSDNTLKIIKEYASNFGDKIFIDTSCNKNLGPAKSFLYLLQRSNADYIFFCDQDDIWVDKKVEICLKKIKDFENMPTLIYSDLELIDSDENVLKKSFFKYKKFNPNKANYRNLCVQNIVTGCTVLINKKAINIAKKIDLNDFIIMHDHILAILISYYGKICFINEALVKYRWHGDNFTNKKEINIKRIVKSYKNQSLSVYNITKDLLFYDFSICNFSFSAKIFFLFKNGFIKNGFIKNLIYMLYF